MIKNKLHIISIIIFLISCSKEKLPEGNYIGEFHYENSTIPDQMIWLKIVTSTKDHMLIGATDYSGNLMFSYLDTLYKNDNTITGKVPSNYLVPFHINGVWFSSNKNFITGKFTQTFYQGGNQYIYSGSFKLNPN